jgi:hypothetical protein
VRARACACAHVGLLVLRATRMCHVVTSFVASLTAPHFRHYLIKDAFFEKKKKLLNINRVF